MSSKISKLSKLQSILFHEALWKINYHYLMIHEIQIHPIAKFLWPMEIFFLSMGIYWDKLTLEAYRSDQAI